MQLSRNSARKYAMAFVLGAGLFAVVSRCAEAKPKQAHAEARGVYDYGPNGPNVSYQAGPHTRIYVSKRSWLDAGTEVLPGDRKFTDYAFPPGYSFARENNAHPLDRQPLNPASDLGGYLMQIPLY